MIEDISILARICPHQSANQGCDSSADKNQDSITHPLLVKYHPDGSRVAEILRQTGSQSATRQLASRLVILIASYPQRKRSISSQYFQLLFP